MAESIRAVERERAKASAKVEVARLSSTKMLEDLTTQLIQYRDSLLERSNGDAEIDEEQASLLSQQMQKAKESALKVSSDHKELHGNISKIGRAIDKNFTVGVDAYSQENAFHGVERTRMLNRVLCDHFLRRGHLEVARSLAQEAGLDLKEEEIVPFYELNRILECCKRRDLNPVLGWIAANHEWLTARKSCLEFKLHRLKFLSLLQEGERGIALEYARNFAPFAELRKREFQQLMGCLAYAGQGLSSSPYSSLLDSVHWMEVCDEFMKEACALSGLPVNSHLAAGLTAGCTALPSLLQIKSVLCQRQVHDMWNAMDELPIEIEVGSEHHYHSVFACPIMKQQSTAENPPMRLSCGHVICRDAIDRLVTGSRLEMTVEAFLCFFFNAVLRLKCPYCPVEMGISDTKEVYF
eukprot:m.169595 g.169595  ORF g.169595 m.169595 type:complete len:410 (+) comp39004_c0_seq4:354-1583(+)